ncbi:MAG: hypothetical protein P8184_02010 [Calditrichia bacterium]
MIPIKIQNIQMGALSADKVFQSLKSLPQNQQRIFEAEVQKQMEDAKDRTEAAEQSEKSKIQDEKKEKQEAHDSAEERHGGKSEEKGRKHLNQNIIEKTEDGTIRHLDVKI